MPDSPRRIAPEVPPVSDGVRNFPYYPTVTVGPITKIDIVVRSKCEYGRYFDSVAARRRGYLFDGAFATPARAPHPHGADESLPGAPYSHRSGDRGGGRAVQAAFPRTRCLNPPTCPSPLGDWLPSRL